GIDATDFEAGVIQNVLASDRRFIYSNKGLIRAVLPSLPMKDGAPKKSGLYDEVFLENGQAGPRILEGFTANDTAVSLELRDKPFDGAAVTLSSDPSCPSGTPSDTLERMILRDKFRTWVGIRHKPSQCVVTKHHIDWETNWEATVTTAADGSPV